MSDEFPFNPDNLRPEINDASETSDLAPNDEKPARDAIVADAATIENDPTNYGAYRRLLVDNGALDTRESMDACLRAAGIPDSYINMVAFSPDKSTQLLRLVAHLNATQIATRDKSGELIKDPSTGKTQFTAPNVIFARGIQQSPEILMDLASTVGEYGQTPERIAAQAEAVVQAATTILEAPDKLTMSKSLNGLQSALMGLRVAQNETDLIALLNQLGVKGVTSFPIDFNQPPMNMWMGITARLVDWNASAGMETELTKFCRSLKTHFGSEGSEEEN